MKHPFVSILFTAVLIASTPLWARDDLPPPGALKLSEVAAQLESEGLDPIIEMEFDDGRWEVKALRNGRKRELRVDPMDARILAEKDDD